MTSLLSLLNSPQAAAAVRDIMVSRYAHERREGRTHEEARAEALDTGDVWTGWLMDGTIERCGRMEARQTIVPQTRERVTAQRERLW